MSKSRKSNSAKPKAKAPNMDPVVIRKAPPSDPPAVERIDLFTIEPEDGEPVTYSMPNKPEPGIGLAYLREARNWGPDLAMSWLIEWAVGSEGYSALVAELEVEEQLRTIRDRILLVIRGQALNLAPKAEAPAPAPTKTKAKTSTSTTGSTPEGN